MSEQISWLMALQRFGMKPGLERMEALLDALDRPEKGIRTVLVGGTNGKGSTASMLAQSLRAAGVITGLFTSPHLTSVMERFVVAGRQLEAEQLEAVIDTVRPPATRLGATFFEVLVACAWLLFRAAGCRTVVLEVGLGGRYDATNASDPALSIITGIDLDHTAVLGETVELVAADKAHLMRPGVTTLSGAAGEAAAVLRRHAERTGARLLLPGAGLSLGLEATDWSGTRLKVSSGDWSLQLHTPLPGRHQALNAALAACAAHLLGVADEAISSGIATTSWPGRLERLSADDRVWLLDGAHNPSAARALSQALGELGARPGVLVLGLTADKDIAGITAELEGLAPLTVATRAELSPRALPPGELAARLSGSVLTADSPAEALKLARQLSKPAELIVVAGSLYLLGEVRPLLSGQRPEGYERWQ